MILEPKRQNYLNNRDLLKEIHKSKSTYCVFEKPEYADYDLILYTTDITEEDIANAKLGRASRLGRAAFDLASVTATEKLKLDQFAVDPDTIPVTDLIFRIVTWDHIPELKAKTVDIPIEELDEIEDIVTEYDLEPEPIPKALTKYIKVNFPPFYHYKYNADNVLEIVGRSHQKGNLNESTFSTDHGQITNKLANMYLKLCDRYATRFNWRNYTYNDEMRATAIVQLIRVGLQFDEAKSQNPFAYYTTVITNSFTRVLNVEKRNQNIRDDILEMAGRDPSYTRQGEGTWSDNM